jgi:signal transduction histidine kinase
VGTHAFSAPVEVRGEPVAELVADASPLRIRRAHDSLETVASELALSLEREQLLAAERETAAALATQNERLRELDGMKDQFVSTVSHELRTPLTSMVGYLEILLAEEVGELSEDQKRFLEIVDRNSRRLNSLIEDILMTSRLDTGRLSIEPVWRTLGYVDILRGKTAWGTQQRRGFSTPDEAPAVPAEKTPS